MKKWFIVPLMILLLGGAATADVILLYNGNIYLGKITNTDSNGIVISTFGQSMTITQSEILKSDKSLESIKGISTDITLRDGSVIKGKIQNYDDEVGIFVNIDFGTVTLPVQSVEGITDTGQRIKYNGYSYIAGFTLGYYMPSGGGGNFNGAFLGTAFLEKDSTLMRGLYLGGSFSYMDMNHDNTDLDYTMLMLEPYISLKYFGFRNSSSFLKRFVPFATLGCGFSYIRLKDQRESASDSSSSELDPVFSAGIGFDVEIQWNLMLRANSVFKAVPQSAGMFTATVFSLGVVYGI